jgi:hypothetical protein
MSLRTHKSYKPLLLPGDVFPNRFGQPPSHWLVFAIKPFWPTQGIQLFSHAVIACDGSIRDAREATKAIRANARANGKDLLFDALLPRARLLSYLEARDSYAVMIGR